MSDLFIDEEKAELFSDEDRQEMEDNFNAAKDKFDKEERRHLYKLYENFDRLIL
jgi:hypothetical protein